MKKTAARRIVAALRGNWQAEMTGHHTYASLAQRESDPARKAALEEIALAERRHADLWAARLSELGASLPEYQGTPSGDAGALLARPGADLFALRYLEMEEARDVARYGRQLRELGDAPSLVILGQVIADERQHHELLRRVIQSLGPLPQLTPEEAQQALAGLVDARDRGQRRAASWVGDAIYGVNDGLGSIFGIVSGVSGATLGASRFVLLAGLAGMVASALSMGSGAYLAAKSEREIYEAEFARERDSVELNEAEAREMLTLSYQVRGLNRDDAERFVEHIARDKQRLVAALARERLDTSEEGLRTPWVSALSGAASTALGAFVPVVPFFFTTGYTAVLIAAVVSLLAHFAVGAAKALITIRSWWSSGLEMTAVGAVEGLVTYAIGVGLGRLGT